MKKLIILSFLALLLLAGCAEKETETFKIYYSASLNGNFDDCGCKMYPRVGLVKRAAYLKGLERGEGSLLLDAGNLLPRTPDKLLEQEIPEVYRELKYDAMAVGINELRTAADTLEEYQDTYPFIANNLALLMGDKKRLLFSTTPAILNRGNYRIGIISIIDDTLRYELDSHPAVEILPSEDAVQGMTAYLANEKVDLVIMLYHGTYMNMRNVLRKSPGIDVVILGSDMELVDIDRVEQTIVVSPGEEGNRLGILELEIDGGVRVVGNRFEEFTSESPDDPVVKARADKYKETLKNRIREN